MTFASRGFRGRWRADADPNRIPPGQHVTDDFPVRARSGQHLSALARACPDCYPAAATASLNNLANRLGRPPGDGRRARARAQCGSSSSAPNGMIWAVAAS